MLNEAGAWIVLFFILDLIGFDWITLMNRAWIEAGLGRKSSTDFLGSFGFVFLASPE